MRRLLPILALLVCGTALAQPAPDKGTTNVRLDAVDASMADKGDFRFFATLLDQRRKPVQVVDPKSWEVFFDGEAKRDTGALTVQLLRDSKQGVSVVPVIAAYGPFGADTSAFSYARKGSEDLLNALRPADRSALVTYGDRIESSGSLTPAHNEAVEWLGERKPGGLSPHLLDAVDKALSIFPRTFDRVGPNRVVIAVTDGFTQFDEKAKERTEAIKRILRLAEERNIRICAIGFGIDDPEKLETAKQLAYKTGGTYRSAETAEQIANLLDHFTSELLEQHVIELNTTDFDDAKEVTFKLRVNHGGRDYDSPNPRIVRIPERESHLLTWLLGGAGAVVGLFLLVFVGRKAVELINTSREPEVVHAGPASRVCKGCGKNIPVDWKSCQFCEQLPHKGRLTVRSAGPANGVAFFIKTSLCNIGSAESNDVVLVDPSVSKRHAGIKVEDNRFELADFGSTNGVLVNGQRIQKQFLKDGDVLSVGVVELEFSLK